MPRYKTQGEKSHNTIALQPERMTPKIMNIIYADIGGHGTGEIAKMTGLTDGRVSIIKGSPLYVARRKEVEEELKKKVVDKHSDNLVNDPAKQKLFELKLAAVNVYGDMINEGKSEFAKLSAANQVCDRTDLRARESSKIQNIIQVTSKLEDRWLRALKVGENDGGDK